MIIPTKFTLLYQRFGTSQGSVSRSFARRRPQRQS